MGAGSERSRPSRVESDSSLSPKRETNFNHLLMHEWVSFRISDPDIETLAMYSAQVATLGWVGAACVSEMPVKLCVDRPTS